MVHKTKIQVFIRGENWDVDICIKYQMVDFGIGHYEYWGAKGCDSRIGAEIDEVTWDLSAFFPEENKIIDATIEDKLDELAMLCEANNRDRKEYYADEEADRRRDERFDKNIG